MTIDCCASGRHHLQCYKAPQCYSPFIIDIWLSIEHSSDLYHWIKIMSQWINTDGFDDVSQATKIHQTSYKSRWRSTFESQLSIRAIEHLKLSAVIQISIWPGERHCAVSQNTHTHTRTAPVICIIQQNLNDRSLFQCVVVLRPSNHSNAVYGVRSPARPYLYIIMFERSSFHPCWLPCAMRPRHSVEYTSFENCSQHYIMPRICDSRRWICAICDQPCKQKLAKRRTTGRAGRIDGAWPWLFKQHAISRFVWFVYRIGDDRGKHVSATRQICRHTDIVQPAQITNMRFAVHTKKQIWKNCEHIYLVVVVVVVEMDDKILLSVCLVMSTGVFCAMQRKMMRNKKKMNKNARSVRRWFSKEIERRSGKGGRKCKTIVYRVAESSVVSFTICEWHVTMHRNGVALMLHTNVLT